MKINRVQKYFFNALILSASGILIHSLSVFFNIYISNKIGSEGMGLYTLTSGVYSFAITLATSGINLAVVKLVSATLPYLDSNENEEGCGESVRKIMKKALLYCLFFSSISTVLLFTLSFPVAKYLLGDLRVAPSLRVMALSLIPISISSALNGYFCAVRRVYKNITVQFCEQGIKILLISSLLTVFLPSGLEYATLALALGGMIGEIISVILSSILYLFDTKIHNLNGKSKKKFIKKIVIDVSKKHDFFSFSVKREEERDSYLVFPVAFPVAISAYVRSLLVTIEHLAIPFCLKKNGLVYSSAIASYGVLHGMVFPLLLFPSSVLGAFSSLLIPEISSSFANKDYTRIRYIVSRVFYFSLLFSLGVSGVFVCFSYEIGMLLYGSTQAGEFIRLLAPLIPLMYLDGAVDAMLKGLGEQVYTMRVNILDSLISIILIFILLPIMGIYGYVVVIFVTELINTSFSILKLINVTKINAPFFKWVFKPLINIILATIITRIFFDGGAFSSLFGIVLIEGELAIFEIVMCALLYLLFSYISGSISKNEISLAKRAFGKA